MKLSTPKELAVFEAVARLESITLAAEELLVSKQTVSDQLKKLEDTVGARLLQRSTRTLSLTDAGARLYPHCAQVAEATKAALEALQEETQEPAGLLTLAASTTFGTHFLAGIVLRYLEAHPKVQIDLRLEDRRFKVIEEGIDLAFLPVQPHGQDLMCKAMFPAEACFVASPELIAQMQTAETDTPFADAPRIEWRKSAEGPVAEQRSVRLRVSSVEVAITAAVRGLGLVKAPKLLVQQHLDAGRLMVVPNTEAAQTSKIYAVFPSRLHVPAKVRAFLTLVQSANYDLSQG